MFCKYLNIPQNWAALSGFTAALCPRRKAAVKDAISEDIDPEESLLKGNHIKDVFGSRRAQIAGPDSSQARRKDKEH